MRTALTQSVLVAMRAREKMDREQAIQYLSSKPDSREDFPFGPQAAVYKVQSKMFALVSHREGNDFINLKCDPDQAFILRDIFPAVRPGYHMNKKHWNTVLLDDSIPTSEVKRMIDHSYSLIIKSLSKKQRLALELKHGPEALYCGQ
jgi:predicted DNA-binding protein (MmcQ/YjbR family)